jgi:excisionase family DNA binding protein
LTIATVAELLSCTDQYVYKLIEDGKLEGIKLGSRAIRISEKSLYDFIAAARINPEDLFDPDREKKETPGSQEIARSKWMQK